MAVIIVGLVFLFLGLLHYFLMKYKFSYWEKKGVPFVKPLPFGIPKLVHILTRSLNDAHLELYNTFPNAKLIGTYEGWRPTLLIKDPEIVKDVLVKNFDHFVDRRTFLTEESKKFDPLFSNIILNLKGQEWKDVRGVMTPAFTSGKMKTIFHTLHTGVQQFNEFLGSYAKTGEPLEFKDCFGRLTMDVIASAAFGIDCNSFAVSKSIFTQMGHKLVVPDFRGIIRMIIIVIFPSLSRLLKLQFFNVEASQFFEDVIKTTIASREKSDSKRNDFLQLILDARKGEITDELDANVLDAKASKKVLSDESLLAQAVIFFAGGFDSTSTSLAFIAYELALSQDIQDKLRDEIISVIEEYGGITYDAIQHMDYLDMVINESMRRHSPVALLERMCTKDYQVPETNILVEKGNMISVSVVGLHMDPEYFPDPEIFDPERFSKSQKSVRNPYVNMPFGMGPRNCIGSRFALMEMKSALAGCLVKFKLLTCEKTEIPIQYGPGLNLRAKNGIWLKVEEL